MCSFLWKDFVERKELSLVKGKIDAKTKKMSCNIDKLPELVKDEKINEREEYYALLENG